MMRCVPHSEPVEECNECRFTKVDGVWVDKDGLSLADQFLPRLHAARTADAALAAVPKHLRKEALRLMGRTTDESN